ncbi:hypothetical protein AB5N19_11829 [Seiridium cardinale]|uniref:Uncharacterized protein n=1 Tax=Seiridium cardinale TaxID=138064 RepID=A0ABR2XHC2_9PEZI
MDFPYKDPAFDDHDLDNVFEYEERESLVVWRTDDEEEVIEQTVRNDLDWNKWSEQEPFCAIEERRRGLEVILAGRKVEGKGHNGSILEYLPFSRLSFERLAYTLRIHGDIARVINRSDSAMFSDINVEDQEVDEIYYTCRTTSKWPGDLAVASTFNRNDGFTASIVFGCDKSTRDSIAARITNFDGSCTHPLIVIAILVELERERHHELVKAQVKNLLFRVYDMSNGTKISETSKLAGQNIAIHSWVEVSQLRTILELWKTQLLKMVTHIDDLECRLQRFGSEPRGALSKEFIAKSPKTLCEVDDTCDTHNIDWQTQCSQTGRRIKNRLLEIVYEYDQNIKDCTMVINGVTLASQLSWNQIGYQDAQANLKIASDTRQDSGQMRSIAILTMIFLPATFVSSLFSMSFFNWSPEEGENILSPYVWIYPVITIGVTAIVVVLWWRFMRGRNNAIEKSPV